MARAAAGAFVMSTLLLGCGDDPDGGGSESATGDADEVTLTPGPDGVQSVDVRGTDEFRFVPSTIHATVGRIRLTFRNAGETPHNMTFRTLDDVGIPTLVGGEERSLDFTASTPGEYRFVCTIHEAQGQTGALIVAR